MATTTHETVLVVGVGPGLGAALGRRFARGGMKVALAARAIGRLRRIATEITSNGGEAAGFACDVTDPDAVNNLFTEVGKRFSPPEVVIFNAGTFVRGEVADTTPETFEHCWKVGCYGGFLVGREAARSMLDRGRGTILFTGATAALRGSAGFVNLAVPKFGLRALAQSMARELGPKGIHVAHVIIDGQILARRPDTEAEQVNNDTRLRPDDIAEAYWFLHSQARDAWTQELDLRPWVERF